MKIGLNASLNNTSFGWRTCLCTQSLAAASLMDRYPWCFTWNNLQYYPCSQFSSFLISPSAIISWEGRKVLNVKIYPIPCIINCTSQIWWTATVITNTGDGVHYTWFVSVSTEVKVDRCWAGVTLKSHSDVIRSNMRKTVHDIWHEWRHVPPIWTATWLERIVSNERQVDRTYCPASCKQQQLVALTVNELTNTLVANKQTENLCRKFYF